MRAVPIAALAAALALAGPSMAKDFTFKSVKPPKPGERRLISIAPAETPVPAPPGTPTARLSAQPASAPAPLRPEVAGFWSAVSPGLADASPARLPEAIRAARGMEPRLARLQAIANDYGREILAATVGTRISPALALAVIHAESAGRPAAVSPAGAVGLMQLMPATAADYGVTDRAEPAQNIRGGVRHLDRLWGLYDGDPVLMLAAYNAGEGAVARAGGVPSYPETRGYVPKVLAAFGVARGLCLTPPELISDGCVFRVASGG